MSEGGRRLRSREEGDAMHHLPPCFSAVSHDEWHGTKRDK